MANTTTTLIERALTLHGELEAAREHLANPADALSERERIQRSNAIRSSYAVASELWNLAKNRIPPLLVKLETCLAEQVAARRRREELHTERLRLGDTRPANRAESARVWRELEAANDALATLDGTLPILAARIHELETSLADVSARLTTNVEEARRLLMAAPVAPMPAA